MVTSDSLPIEDRKPQVNQAHSALCKETYGVSPAGELDELTERRLSEVDPENTRLAYRRVAESFDSWCAENGLASLPAPASTLTRYISHMVTLGRAPATISQHLGAIRTRHNRAGHIGEPNSYQASRLLRKYRRDLAKDGKGQRQAIPITPDSLRAMVGTLDLDTIAGQRDQLALVLGFTGMLRRSELVGLHAQDVTVTEDGVTLLVRTSKGDKNSLGRHVPIPPQKSGVVEPVALTERWLRQVGYTGHLLRRVSRSGELTAYPWRPAGVNDLVKRAAKNARLPSCDRYTAHSLRAGGLTAALRSGKPLGVAARHGGWDPESPVPSRYARVADQWRDNAMTGVL